MSIEKFEIIKPYLIDLSDNVGDKADFIDVPFTPNSETVIAYLQTGYYHVHGASFIHPDKANPVSLQAGAGAWGAGGAITEVIPANTIQKAFDLHWINVSDISATGYLVIDIYAGPALSEQKIGSVDVFRNSNFVSEGARMCQIPQQPANTRISCKLSDSTAGQLTCAVKFSGHVYGTSL